MILACASHLLVDLPLFGGPVVLIAGSVGLIARSERRRAGRRAADSPAARQPEDSPAARRAADSPAARQPEDSPAARRAADRTVLSPPIHTISQ